MKPHKIYVVDPDVGFMLGRNGATLESAPEPFVHETFRYPLAAPRHLKDGQVTEQLLATGARVGNFVVIAAFSSFGQPTARSLPRGLL